MLNKVKKGSHDAADYVKPGHENQEIPHEVGSISFVTARAGNVMPYALTTSNRKARGKSCASSGAMPPAMRADEFPDQGNLDGKRLWLRIMQTIEEPQRERPEDGKAVHRTNGHGFGERPLWEGRIATGRNLL